MSFAASSRIVGVDEVTVSAPAFHVITACAWVLPILTFVVSFSMAETLHDLPYDVSTLSATISHSPESCVGTFGLGIGLWCFSLVIILRYARAVAAGGRCRHWAPHLLRIGLVATLGGLGVASFQLSRLEWGHYLSAAVFFVCALLYVCGATVVDYRQRPAPRVSKLLWLRIALSVLSVVAFVMCGVSNMIGQRRATEKQLEATFEILCFLCLLGWMATIHAEQQFGFVLYAAQRPEAAMVSLLDGFLDSPIKDHPASTV